MARLTKWIKGVSKKDSADDQSGNKAGLVSAVTNKDSAQNDTKQPGLSSKSEGNFLKTGISVDSFLSRAPEGRGQRVAPSPVVVRTAPTLRSPGNESAPSLWPPAGPHIENGSKSPSLPEFSKVDFRYAAKSPGPQQTGGAEEEGKNEEDSSARQLTHGYQVLAVKPVHADVVGGTIEEKHDGSPQKEDEKPGVKEVVAKKELVWAHNVLARKAATRKKASTFPVPAAKARPCGEYDALNSLDEGLDAGAELLAEELQGLPVNEAAQLLLEGLMSGEPRAQLHAAAGFRFLSISIVQEWEYLRELRVIPYLVAMLTSPDPAVSAKATLTILNIAGGQNALHPDLVDARVIPALVEVLKFGRPVVAENAAAALFSLSYADKLKPLIVQAGVLPPLLSMLASENPGNCKKDNARLLFSLTLNPNIVDSVVDLGGLEVLLHLLAPDDPALEEVVVATISNIVKSKKGVEAVRNMEGAISTLVEILEGGTPRGREDAAAALLLLCLSDRTICRTLKGDGALIALAELSKNGRPRARLKAQALIEVLRQVQG